MAVDVFISYAREDRSFLRELETHLAPLRHDGIISHWTDEQIVPGESWRNAIAERIRRAKLVLLLVSPDFLASEFCYRVELNDAIAKAKAGSAYVVPIVVRECDWSSAPFAFLQALPEGGRAVAGRDWPSRDAAWKSVIQGLRMTLDETRKRADLRQRQMLFGLLGFGAEVSAELPTPPRVWRAKDAEGVNRRCDEVESVGTRHRAAFRFVNDHPTGLAIVISQDGGVSFVANRDGEVVVWEQSMRP